MAIQKANKLRNVVNVTKEILRDPLQTEREIAAKLGIDRSTVNRAKDELHEITPKEERLAKLVETDLDIQELAQKEMQRRLTQEPQEVPGADLKGFSEITLKRSQLLSGKPTDRNVNELPDEQLERIASAISGR